MKISIEVDLAPSEFELASELLRTLNLFTEHVKVKGHAPAGASSSGAVAAVPAPLPVPVPVPPPAAVPPAPAVPSTPQDARRMFGELISRLADPSQLDAVAAEAARIFGSGPLSPAALADEFLEAFYAVAFDTKLIAAEQSVAPFMHLLPRLPDAVRDGAKGIKARIIAKVLGHLNQKRPITTAREEFYLQAEAFAVLCQMEFVGIDGAVQTMEKLLKNAEKRAAAITTLGKTVEKCKDKLGSANKQYLSSLFGVLDSIAEPGFQYDISWINNNLQRSRAPQPAAPPPAVAPPPAAAAPPQLPPAPGPVKLSVARTFTSPAISGADGTYFTLAWDPTAHHLVSGGREVPVTVWSSDGRVLHTIDQPGMYVCCIDVDVAAQLVLMCGIYDAPTSYRSRITLFDGRPNAGFAPRGDIIRQEVDMTAVVRALPGTSSLVTGESVRLPDGTFREQIALYDINRVMQPGPSGAAVEPQQRFEDHKNLVTCIAPLGASNPGVFVSGSRDCTVKIWDVRSGSTAVATLGVPPGDFASTTHAEMVTCVDVAGHTIVSGSLDASLAAWDLRQMDGQGNIRPFAVAGPTSLCTQNGQSVTWANHGILKVSLDGSPFDKLAAVATVQGLYTVDFAPAAPVITAAAAYAADGVTPKQYNDIKWATGSSRLFASAGDGVAIDVLNLQAGA